VSTRTCSVEGCTNPHRAKGLCFQHYYQARHLIYREEDNARCRRYALIHHEEIKKRKKAYWLAHHEEHKAKQRAYYWANRDELNNGRDRNRDKILRRQWNLKHPLEARAMAANRRARERAVANGIVRYKAIVERDGMICGICGKKVKPEELSFDHIVPLSAGGGHTENNIQVAHKLCNLRKGRGWLASQIRLPLATRPQARCRITWVEVMYG
jgi:5-methylcytosine-specific restriction endonuclease McrA